MFVSLRDCMVADEKMFASPLDGMRHLGVEAVEVALDRDFSVYAMDSLEKTVLATDEDARAWRGRLGDMGIVAHCFLTACDFSAGDREENVQWVTRALELADAVGMPVVRIDSAMARERELDFGERVELFADGLGEALRRTEGSRVTMGIENHGYQGNNLAFQLNVYNTVGSDRLGATMDTGNFYWRGYPLSEVYGILNILAPYTKHSHLKNIKYPVETREEIREAGWEYGTYVAPLDEGDIDHARVLRILDGAGYDGDICIEDESLGHYDTPEDRVKVLERDVAHVKDIIQQLG
ncbi:MAG: sugar phosphate isomerase/epimerase [bacterium]|nr:sugar phosphate isomerase/epimerase [bacterium]